MNEERAIGRCENCGELIYEEDIDTYMDSNGNYFCCQQCVNEFYEINKVDE